MQSNQLNQLRTDHARLVAENAALREQIAQVTNENNSTTAAYEAEHAVVNDALARLQGETQLAKEREIEIRQVHECEHLWHLVAVVPADRRNFMFNALVFQLTESQSRTVAEVEARSAGLEDEYNAQYLQLQVVCDEHTAVHVAKHLVR